MRIISFNMWTSSIGSQYIDANLSLAIMPVFLYHMNAGDNRQIAWTTGEHSPNGSMAYRTFIDPNHVVNRDLFINANCTGGLWNWLIIFEEYTLSDDEAIVQIIKETSQNTTP
jgi:hypothetical protein